VFAEAAAAALRFRNCDSAVTKAARYCELRIGELLGPGIVGENQHSEGSLAGEGSIPKDDRHKFRLMAENKHKEKHQMKIKPHLKKPALPPAPQASKPTNAVPPPKPQGKAPPPKKPFRGPFRKPPGRLPDKSSFTAVYDGPNEMWTITLTIPGLLPWNFKGSHLFKTLSKLDDFYRHATKDKEPKECTQ
jgi:hypothetical protein